MHGNDTTNAPLAQAARQFRRSGALVALTMAAAWGAHADSCPTGLWQIDANGYMGNLSVGVTTGACTGALKFDIQTDTLYADHRRPRCCQVRPRGSALRRSASQ